MKQKSKRQNTGFFGLPILLVTVLILVAGLIIFKNRNAPGELPLKNLAQDVKKSLPSLNPTLTPTPFPFRELTVPYLQSRNYQSSLEELTQVSENESFTSYTTSYSSDNLKINGMLTVPNGPLPRSTDGETGWPAIIFIHGYIPPQNYRTTVNYVSFVDHLARSGFVVFKIDLRGHDKSEGDASGAYYSGDYIIDTLNAYSALQSSELVNSKKIGLWGHSMAGNVVMRATAAKPDIPAAVIWAGAVYTYSDMRQYGISDGSYQPPDPNSERARERRELRELYGDFDPNNEFWKQVPPTNYLDGIKTAVQLHHSVDDGVVSIEYSRNLVKILEAASVAHELYEYPSGGHNLVGTSFELAMDRAVEFFKKYM